MKLSLLFARRYLRSKKSLSVINSTASVSSVAIGVAVAAMVVLMSVFNGFDTLLHTIDNSTGADLEISPRRGTTIKVDSLLWAEVDSVEGVVARTLFLEESVMVEYGNNQTFATLRGVDDNYTEVVPLDKDDLMWYGEWQLRLGERRKAVVGFTLDHIFADGYSVRNAALHKNIHIHALRKENISMLLPMSAIRTVEVAHAGTLADGATELTNHLFVSLDVAQELLGASDRASAVALKIAPNESVDRVKGRLLEVVGKEYQVTTRFERNEILYKVTKIEKISIFFILLLVTLIAAVSIIGSLVMLIIEKRNDTATLYAMGARSSFVREVFTLEGMLIGLRGAFWGVIGGLAVCLAQIKLGLVKMPGNTFLVENYPVEVRLWDIVLILLSVAAVNFMITNFTVRKMLPRNEKPDETRI